MSTAAPTPRFYRPSLDVMRFVCFILVFLHHVIDRTPETVRSGFLDAFGFSVPAFFLLSSFLITELLLRERTATGTVHVKAFYLRRILRIWPLYFGFFALCWISPYVLHLMKPIPTGMTVACLLLVGNWYISLHGVLSNAVTVLWSVSVEEQYYVVWPLLMRGNARRVITVVSGIVLVVSYLSIAFLANRGFSSDVQIWSNTLVQMQFFALGALLAVYLPVVQRIKLPRLSLAVLWIGAWFCSAYFTRLKRSDLHITPGHASLGFVAVAIGTVAMFLTFYDLPIGKDAVSRMLTYFGKISYGLYIFHILGIVATDHLLAHRNLGTLRPTVEPVIALTFTMIAAALSYRFYETPFLRLKERFTFVRSRTV